MTLRVSAVLLIVLSACGKKTQPPIEVPLTAGCNPFAATSECLYPFPSAFFQKEDSTSPTGVRVNYPTGIFGQSSTGIAVDPTPYNTADGVPPLSPILLFFAADVDLTNIPNQFHEADSVLASSPIALFDLDTGARVPFFAEMDENRIATYPNRYAFIIRPMAPMVTGHRHAVVLTLDVKLANGSSLPQPLAFTALRDDVPTTNTLVESYRSKYESMFTLFAANGYPRENIALAWDFMVASSTYILGPIQSMRTTALAQLGTTGFPYTIDSIAATPEGGELVEGNFEVPTFINANNVFDWDSNHLPQEQATNSSFPYTWYIPSFSLVAGAKPVPLGIFGHGLFGTGRAYLDTDSGIAPTIRGMAERSGVSLIATDWIGLSGTADNEAVGAMVATDINQVGMITNQLTQSLINNIAMTKLARGNLQQDPQVKPADHDIIDLTRTYYYGVSLGGIQGASLISISDDITRGVLAVPGCDWSTMFPRSVDWTDFAAIADPTYPDPLQELTLLSLMQAQFDFDDSGNLTTMLLHNPLPGAPAKTVVLQESIGDSQVPNIVTEVLARAIGVQQIVPDYSDIFGLEQTTSPTTGSSISQYLIASDVLNDWPPTNNTVPANDNGAHFGLNFLPNVQQQIINMVDTGEIDQYCQNVCTPY